MQAKREIGRLWEDVTKVPYKQLFNSGLTATKLWNAVQVLRVVDDTLRDAQSTMEGRDRSIAIHGNRLIAHLVFLSMRAELDQTPETPMSTDQIPELTRAALRSLEAVIAESYASNYLASLFKNASRCRDLALQAANGVGARAS